MIQMKAIRPCANGQLYVYLFINVGFMNNQDMTNY